MSLGSIPRENGNVVFIILIAIALFAALVFAVTQSNKGGGTINKEQTVLNAAKAIQYSNTIRQAILRLKLTNSCTDDQYNFASSEWPAAGTLAQNGIYKYAGNVNPWAPVDKRCNIFDKEGGDVAFQAPTPGANDGTHWAISGSNFVEGHGTDGYVVGASDLVAILPFVTLDVCKEINRNLHGNTTIPAGILMDITNFTGTYWGYSDISGAGIAGVSSGCIELANIHDGDNVIKPVPAGTYIYYDVILVR